MGVLPEPALPGASATAGTLLLPALALSLGVEAVGAVVVLGGERPEQVLEVGLGSCH